MSSENMKIFASPSLNLHMSPKTLWPFFHHWGLQIGFFTDTGIPVVIRSWTPQVRGGIWHTMTYHVPVPRCYGYVTGILPPGEHKFYGFETHFLLNLINFFILSHRDTTKYGSASCVCIFLPLTIKQHSTPTPITQQKTK